MMEPRHDDRVLTIVSPQADDVAALVEACGWRVAAPDQAQGAELAIVDARVSVDQEVLGALRGHAAIIAVVGTADAPILKHLVDQGVTHFLAWPSTQPLLDATLTAALRLCERVRKLGMASDPDEALPPGDRDALTGLASRHAAREWLDERLSQPHGAGVTACLLVGISQFASINAAYGKVAGDAALTTAAERIGNLARHTVGSDALVARIGGTEYLVAFVGGTDAGPEIDARDLARLILTDLSRPFVAHDNVVRLTARCGIAEPAPGDDASRMLRRASAALAEARHSSTRDIVRHSGVRLRGHGHADDVDRLDADLRLAIDGGEIGIVYQPQYDSHNDRIVGVEALARWNHPILGQLDAATLFEAADRSDYLLPLSLHIQRKAMEEAGRWPAALNGLRLSVNVTAADLAQTDFLSTLLGMIEDSGFPRHRVTVEITETGLIENIERAADLLHQLRRRNLRVAIDDFGTGYSSLAYLKALHPDYLKIDHSLSRDILGTPRDRIILRAIIAMARSLALTVIAEGVESEEQLTLLAREGCDIYQGFLRSPAVTSEELVELAKRGG